MFKRKFNVIFIVFAVILIVVLSTGIDSETTAKTRVFSVVIDAGHGGIDGGAEGVNTGVKESDLNLKIAKILQQKFTLCGFNTTMTREDENGLYGTTEKGFKLRDLAKRVEIINGSNADLVISIHLNQYSSKKRRGAQVFYSQKSESGRQLAEHIQSRINGMKLSPRILSALKGDYYILNESNVPSVIVECGFLSSPEDEKLLISTEYQNAIATAIVNGSLAYLASKK